MMLNKIKLQILVISLCLITISVPARAELTIDITLWLDNATPIAVVPFGWRGVGKVPMKMTDVIANDLGRSGQFAPMKENEMIELPHEGRDVNFPTWRNVNMKYVVVGKIQLLGAKSYQVQFQLLDVDKGTQLTGHSFQAKENQLRRLSHHISDLIYEAITGERGAFDTYLAYITVSRNKNGQNRYRLAISDSDGYNEQILFESSMPIVRPVWSPDGQRLAYVSYATGRPQIYIQNVFTKNTQRLTNFKGSNLSPAWSPDGRKMAMSLSKDGNAELYIMDLNTKRLHRVTRSYGADLEPAWFPDGRKLVFTSDRGGRAQLYTIDVNDSGAAGSAKRITFDGKENLRPDVSPDGKSIAMVHNSGGKYQIALLDLETDQLSLLTDGQLDESPGFAPNGSMLIYAAQAGDKGVLAAVSADGRASQKMRFTSGDVREPAWSPYKQD
ncbi:MAG: Tol-Pal system beta propeller repeat protein TolB [Thioalkalispiraceae bacterium]|jgi:TolB protein